LADLGLSIPKNRPIENIVDTQFSPDLVGRVRNGFFRASTDPRDETDPPDGG
jgi:hypothetical protein